MEAWFGNLVKKFDWNSWCPFLGWDSTSTTVLSDYFYYTKYLSPFDFCCFKNMLPNFLEVGQHCPNSLYLPVEAKWLSPLSKQLLSLTTWAKFWMNEIMDTVFQWLLVFGFNCSRWVIMTWYGFSTLPPLPEFNFAKFLFCHSNMFFEHLH